MPKRKAREARAYRTSFPGGKPLYEVDCGNGYEKVTKKQFDRLTAAMRKRMKAARKLAEGSTGVVVAAEGKIGRRVRPVGKGHRYPYQSDSLAVHVSQIAEAEERNKKRGCTVRYNPKNGNAVIESEGQFQDLLRVERDCAPHMKDLHRKNCYNN